MRIYPVSLSFQSKHNEDKYNSAYLYTAKKQTQCSQTPVYFALTAFAAMTAVIVTLFNIGGNKNFPKV